ncbi:hypothetical protein BG842_06105 [Haladaptatus sp. W1]|nr:hypothetical protein BG842_06105 [Haladaptatus sp. W1]
MHSYRELLIQLYSALILKVYYLNSAGCRHTMDSDTSTPTPEEMRDKLGDQRRKMLATLNRADEATLDTSTLRQRADVPTGSIDHHLKLLTRWNLIEQQPDRTYTGQGGSRARVWQLTDDGVAFIEEHDDVLSPPETAQTATRVTALENRIEDLEAETRQRRQVIIDILEVISGAQDDETQKRVQQILAEADTKLS